MNKPYISCILVMFIIVFVIINCSPQKDKIQLTGDYIGQAPPDTLPELFAPGLISDGYNNRDMAISPDGNRIFYSIFLTKRTSVIMFVQRENGVWNNPVVAQFSGKYSDLEPAFSPDGKRLYFASNRPFKNGDPAKDYDIWYVDLCDAGWKEPVNLGEPINSEQNEFYPSLTRDGVLYFTAPYEGGEDIFRSKMIGGKFNKPKRLDDAVNSPRGEFNALIAPDESYLIFSSYGRDDNLGGGDMYISFRNEDDTWTKAVNLGAPLNSSRMDYCPALSPDGKYLFFSSSRLSKRVSDAHLKSFADIDDIQNSPGNGNDDIYWVNAQILEKYKNR